MKLEDRLKQIEPDLLNSFGKQEISKKTITDYVFENYFLDDYDGFLENFDKYSKIMNIAGDYDYLNQKLKRYHKEIDLDEIGYSTLMLEGNLEFLQKVETEFKISPFISKTIAEEALNLLINTTYSSENNNTNDSISILISRYKINREKLTKIIEQSIYDVLDSEFSRAYIDELNSRITNLDFNRFEVRDKTKTLLEEHINNIIEDFYRLKEPSLELEYKGLIELAENLWFSEEEIERFNDFFYDLN